MSNADLSPEVDAVVAECRVLHDLVASMPANTLEEPTGFKGWTAVDILSHLHFSDATAMAALHGKDAYWGHVAGYVKAEEAGERGVAYMRRWHGLDARALVSAWLKTAEDLARTFRGVDPKHRVYWGRGPDMSARSCVTARQMEVWSHGQALFDLVGRDRPEADRLRNVAHMCAITFGWAFRVRGLQVPARPPRIQLIAPSGATWVWNEPDAADRICGSAVEFCQVGTQTRNITDTALRVEGEVARQWMAIAQCFAGPPHDPPLPGTRRKRLT